MLFPLPGMSFHIIGVRSSTSVEHCCVDGSVLSFHALPPLMLIATWCLEVASHKRKYCMCWLACSDIVSGIRLDGPKKAEKGFHAMPVTALKALVKGQALLGRHTPGSMTPRGSLGHLILDGVGLPILVRKIILVT